MKRLKLAIPLLLLFTIAGCKDPYGDCVKTGDGIAKGIGVALADLPALQATGLFSLQEEANIAGYLNAANTLNAQFQVCVTNAHSVRGTPAAYRACVDIFANGLKDPKELALLRVVSASGQQKVQLWVNAIQTPIDSLLAGL